MIALSIESWLSSLRKYKLIERYQPGVFRINIYRKGLFGARKYMVNVAEYDFGADMMTFFKEVEGFPRFYSSLSRAREDALEWLGEKL